jgi:TetR/AcrR family transcriptional regulator
LDFSNTSDILQNMTKILDKIQSQCTKASEKTREHLLEAARDLFSVKGFHGVSVKEICVQANCNISLVSYHYGGKEGLYKSCIEVPAEKEHQAAMNDLVDVDTFDEFVVQLNNFGNNMLCRASEDFRLYKIVSREMESEDLIIAELFEKTYHSVFVRMCEKITDASNKGWLRKDLHPPLATMLFLGTLMHAIRSEGLRKKFFNRTLADVEYRKTIVDQIIGIFINGIKA